jgi:hypothetical protein
MKICRVESPHADADGRDVEHARLAVKARGDRPFLEQAAGDVAITGTPRNGVAEPVEIAAMADAYEATRRRR